LIAAIIRRFIIACPVDIAVYDNNGTLLAKTAQGKLTGEGSKPELITLEGDLKIVIDPDGVVDEIRFAAYDTGAMTYTVQDINPGTGEVQREKVFRNVALAPGKEMRSNITETPSVNLLYTDDSKVVAEIQENGSEAVLDSSGQKIVVADATKPTTQNAFFDMKGASEGSVLPKTGVGINWTMVGLVIVFLLDGAFIVWTLLKVRRRKLAK
jgi:hypothetical protein